jgi:O-antigen/teichoic acid export membrane protein
MSETLRSGQLARNLITSWLTYALRLCIALLFVPYITSVLGEDRYGVWVISFQAIAFFSLFDFGFERALIRFVSKALSKFDFDAVNKALNTTWAIYLFVGTIIIAGAAVTATFLFDYLKIDDPVLAEEGRAAFMVFGLFMGFRFYFLPFGGMHGAFQRQDVYNFLAMAEETVRVLALVWLLSNHYGLPFLAGAILIVSVLRNIVGAVVLKHLYPATRVSLHLADRSTLRDMLAYSRVSFGITAAWLVIFNSDTVLLGLFGSAAAAGIYAPGAQFMLHFRGFAGQISTPITSAVSHWQQRNELATVATVYLRGLTYLSYIATLVAVGVLFWANRFVTLWLPAEFVQTATVMRILVIGTAIFAPQILGTSVVFGMSRHASLLRLLVVEATVKLLLAVILIPRYGLIGMALAATIPQGILYLFVYPFMMRPVLHLSTARLFRSIWSGAVAAAVISIPASWAFMHVFSAETWPAFLLGVLLTTVLTLGLGFLFLSRDARIQLVRLVRPFRKSGKSSLR